MPARSDIVDPQREPEDAQLETALRPASFEEYVGQEQLKDNLQVFIRAARERGEALDHVLFSGPPGLGKTTLAHLIAREMGVGLRTTSGPVIERAGDLAAILTNLAPRDVLFIDEIHRLAPVVEEILYPAMEDCKIDLVIGQGPAARSVRLDLQPFTLVGATTRAGLLTSPLRDRFGIVSRLNFYTVDELCRIVRRSARLLDVPCRDDGLAEIARRSRGTPRIANRLLRRVRDFAQIEGGEVSARRPTGRCGGWRWTRPASTRWTGACCCCSSRNTAAGRSASRRSRRRSRRRRTRSRTSTSPTCCSRASSSAPRAAGSRPRRPTGTSASRSRAARRRRGFSATLRGGRGERRPAAAARLLRAVRRVPRAGAARAGAALTGYFFNPNIQPADEHARRREALERFAPALGLDLVVPPTRGPPPGRRRRRARGGALSPLLRTAPARDGPRGAPRRVRRLLDDGALLALQESRTDPRRRGGAARAEGVPFLYRDLRAGWDEGGRPTGRAGCTASGTAAACPRNASGSARAENGRDRSGGGVIDLHTHILPGLDHGPGDWDEALEMCRIAVADGIATLAATPHVSEVFPNSAQRIEAAVAELRQRLAAAGIPLAVVAGGDYHVRPDLAPRNVLTLGGNGRYFLLEFPYQVLPLRADAFVATLLGRGLAPIVTHPERTASLQRDWRRLEPIVKAGALVQVTAGSLLGKFGPRRQRPRSAFSRRAGCTCSRATRTGRASECRDSPQGAPRPRASSARSAAQALVEENPRAILEGRDLAGR